MVDLTINASPRTIRLKGVGTRLERSTATTITPGALVHPTSADQIAVHPTAGRNTAAMFALENELIGKGIDDNYVSGDLVQVEHFDPGDWVLAYVAASASAILEGDLLESAGDGSLRRVSSDYDDAIAMAMQALDNSGGGTIARIIVAII